MRPVDEWIAPVRISRKAFLRGSLGAGAVALVSRGDLAQAAAPADRVTVDLSRSQGRPSYVATGFLHGLSQDGGRPPAGLVDPIKPTLFRGSGSALPGGAWSLGGEAGYRLRWENAAARYRRISALPNRAEYVIVMSDLWGAEGVTLQPTDPYPGDGGDWSSYEAFVRQVMADAEKAGMRPDVVQYEIWNEPDYTTRYFPRTWEQYQQLWQRGYRLIKELQPNARIEGPTYTGIRTTGAAWQMDDFLDMAVGSDTGSRDPQLARARPIPAAHRGVRPRPDAAGAAFTRARPAGDQRVWPQRRAGPRLRRVVHRRHRTVRDGLRGTGDLRTVLHVPLPGRTGDLRG